MHSVSKYTIRPAAAADARFLYELAMDPRIRLMGTRQQEFTFGQHERWYEQRRNDGLTAIWIMEVEDIPVGQVRYGRIPHTNVAETAISVVPREWRKGYALAMLRETMPWACEQLGVTVLVALVLEKNAASKRLFQTAGFQKIDVERRMGRRHRRYEWRTWSQR